MRGSAVGGIPSLAAWYSNHQVQYLHRSVRQYCTTLWPLKSTTINGEKTHAESKEELWRKPITTMAQTHTWVGHDKKGV